MVLRKSFYIRWSAGRSPRVHEVNPGRDPSGLKLSIRGRIVGFRLRDMDSMVGTALTIEREIEDTWNTRDTGVGSKREDQFSSSSGKRQKTFA